MKVYRSKNGYFYKEYKNGKKRITENEYKKFKSKNKKKGGNYRCSNKIVSNKLSDLCIRDDKYGEYKTYEECAFSGECLTKWNKYKYIRLLKNNNLYEKWVENGSYFGIIQHPPGESVVIYKDMFNNNVGVNMVSTDFYDIEKGVSFPVFNYVSQGSVYDLPQYLLNGIPIRLKVKQGQFLIVPKTESLTTAGLATCSGLAMIIGTKKFLTHLDATTNIVPIINAIKDTLTEENMTSANIDEIRVWQGTIYGRNHALNKVDRILEAIGINPTSPIVVREDVCYMDEKYI